MKHDLCTVKDCLNFGRYCRIHPGGSIKEKKPIKKESKKRASINRKEYGPKAKMFVQDRPICEMGTPVCTGQSMCVHHTRGKNSKEDLLDERYWKASCFACNNWVEQNDLAARQRGLKLSKFSKA